jgi:hypothetical protein
MTVLIGRSLLAGVFAIAAIAKLTDRDGVRRMVVEFGSPPRLAPALAWALIVCEAGVAAALIVEPSARIGALAALTLLLTFGVAVAIAVGRGRRPECHCFGRVRSGEVGWSTVARNALLAAAAGYVAASGRAPIVFGALAATVIATWLAIRARARARLAPGAPAPWLPDSLLAADRPLLLLFSDPDCGACRELMPEVERWRDELASALTIEVLGSSAGDAYGVTATPTAVLVDAHGRIAARPAVGPSEIAHLVARATAPGPQPTRRTALRYAAAGVASIVAEPLVSTATAAARIARAAARPKKLKIDGAWLCDQRYALCTFAACKPSKTHKNVSVCRCKVKTGYSVGFKTCEKRAPRGRQLHSNFSLQDVTNRTRVLKCSERGLWVQCLDVVCEVDRDDPRHASCQCVNERTKNFFTFGGNCDTKTCSRVIWSATTAPFPGGAQYEKGLRRLGIPFKSPAPCPTPKHG